MAFDYVVSLDLAGRRCLVVGDGPLAAERARGLVDSGAEVTVITPSPSPGVVPDEATHVARLATPDDLDGCFLAIVTREDDAAVTVLWAAAEERGVLFAALDDVEHCHFGAVSTVRRGPLRVTVSTSGRAPALAKRLRRRLERDLGPEHGRLVDLLHEARRQVLPRTAPFETWSRRWEDALEDLDTLLEWTRDGHEQAVVDHVHGHIAQAGTPITEVAR